MTQGLPQTKRNKMLCLRLLGYGNLDAQVLDAVDNLVGHAGIGNNEVDLVHRRNLAEAPAAKLRGVGQDNGFLRRAHHHAVEHVLAHNSVGESQIEVYAFDAKK